MKTPRSLYQMCAVWLAIGLLSACSGSIEQKQCKTDSSCPQFEYCSEAKKCTQDCDPRQVTNTCAMGLSCSSRGKCVDSTVMCQDNSDCQQPPADATPFCDGTTSVSPKSIGRCIDAGEGKRCQYDDERIPCPDGCDQNTGLCIENNDPCKNKTCDEPPGQRCKDGMTLVKYESMGMCMADGSCSYQEREEVCTDGCENNACKAGGCDGKTCDMPPANRCAQDNPNLAIQYDAMGTCNEENGAASCSYPTTLINCVYQGATCQDGACVNGKTQSGEVIITEIMVEPVSPLTKSSHQWFEVYNTTNADVDLQGWRIVSATPNATESHTIAAVDMMGNPTPLIVPSGGYLLLANGADPLGNATAPGYVYADVQLSFEDHIELVNTQGNTVDYVYWEAGSMIDGRSRGFDPMAAQDAQSNDNFASWCPELASAYDGGANYGSPAGANTACNAQPCGAFTCPTKPNNFCNAQGDAVTYTIDNPMCEVSRFNNPYCDFGVMEVNCDANTTLCVAGTCEMIPANLPQPGQVLITETLGNPVGTDGDGEWIELYNTTDQPLSLFSLKITDNEQGSAFDSYQILNPAATIPAKGYAVLSTNVDMMTNGGITGAYQLGDGILKNSPTLDAMMKSTMRLRLVTHTDTLIDEAYYFESSANTMGASYQLSVSAYKDVMGAETGNDTDASWCAGTFMYDTMTNKGLGTPGAENAVCQ